MCKNLMFRLLGCYSLKNVSKLTCIKIQRNYYNSLCCYIVKVPLVVEMMILIACIMKMQSNPAQIQSKYFSTPFGIALLYIKKQLFLNKVKSSFQHWQFRKTFKFCINNRIEPWIHPFEHLHTQHIYLLSTKTRLPLQ